MKRSIACAGRVRSGGAQLVVQEQLVARAAALCSSANRRCGGSLSRWLAARHSEAAAGLAPAFGVGGSGIVRPQPGPRRRVLAHESFGPSPGEADATLLFLHRLGATSSTWAQQPSVAARRVTAAPTALLS
jgi:hypothetical protein